MMAAAIIATMNHVLRAHLLTHSQAQRQIKLDVCARMRMRLCVLCTCTNQVL